MEFLTIKRIQQFAEAHDHLWATVLKEKKVILEELLPKCNDGTPNTADYNMPNLLQKIDQIVDEYDDELEYGLRCRDCFTLTENKGLVKSYHHITSTGRLEVIIEHDEYLLKIWRPGKVTPYIAIAAHGRTMTFNKNTLIWIDVEEYGQCEFRHRYDLKWAMSDLLLDGIDKELTCNIEDSFELYE
jgi:hypothetical protein